jgi:hypothetical protein
VPRDLKTYERFSVLVNEQVVVPAVQQIRQFVFAIFGHTFKSPHQMKGEGYPALSRCRPFPLTLLVKA